MTPIETFLPYGRSNLNTLLGKSPRYKPASESLSGKKKHISALDGRMWNGGFRKVLYSVTNGRAKSNTGWKTCINAPWIHTITK